MKSLELTIESLTVHLALDRLKNGGVEVLSAHSPAKNVLVLRIDGKERKKAFAILKGSCYNIKNVRKRGTLALAERARLFAGLLAGFVLFFAAMPLAETRVLRVDVVGSGAYYEREIRGILTRAGVRPFSPPPKDRGALEAEILSLPRVEFCSLSKRGGVLTVEVQTSETAAPLPAEPLLSPAAGKVKELTVVRGTPLAEVGQEVAAGQEVVSCLSSFGGQEKKVAVIAKIVVEYRAEAEYPLGREEAITAAFLEFGELTDIQTMKTPRGWRVTGKATATAASNLA